MSATDFDKAISALDKISQIGQLRDLVFYALDAAKPRCGNCYFWMKSRDCPREHNVKGISRGPSSGENPCPKYRITHQASGLIRKRTDEAVVFAKQHGLPIPAALEPETRND